jgi:hypothetical protein
VIALPIQLLDGGRALAVAYSSAGLSLICECAYPPGKPLALTAELGGGMLALQGKSGGSRRRADGRYDVTLRLISLRREQREQLERAFANG